MAEIKLIDYINEAASMGSGERLRELLEPFIIKKEEIEEIISTAPKKVE